MSATAATSPEPQFRRLLPQGAAVTAGELLGDLDLVACAHSDLPYTIVNFVASLDGRAAFNGRSAPLTDPGDRVIFHGLREIVDAVLAGTGTLRTERYGRLVRDPARRERRAASGLAPDPLACVITRSGDVPDDIPLFADPSSRIALFSAGDPAMEAVAANVDVVKLDPGELTLTTVLRRLRADFGIRALLCEGGPIVFAALLQEDLVDELFMTISPHLTGGGTDPTVTNGPTLAEPAALALVWALERDGTLFLRYARDRG